MHLFFTPDIKEDDYTLAEEESKHCVKVLRLQQGDTVYLVDGKGGRYTALIMDAHHKRCRLQVVAKQYEFGRLPYVASIAVAPTKNMDRMEWFVEKAVEIGISEIFFLECDHSERRNLKLDRLEKIAISAMKQSQKGYLPQLHELMSFRNFIENCEAKETFIAHLEQDATQTLKEYYQPGKPHCILIGPEGDFSEAEIALAYEKGIRPITLGKSRLRTETAALVACHTLHVLHDLLEPL